jgi:hypothetical protein
LARREKKKVAKLINLLAKEERVKLAMLFDNITLKDYVERNLRTISKLKITIQRTFSS